MWVGLEEDNKIPIITFKSLFLSEDEQTMSWANSCQGPYSQHSIFLCN